MTSLSTVVVLSLVAWRVGHLIVSDAILAPIRDRVQGRWPVTPEAAGVRRFYGQLGINWAPIAASDRRRVRPYGPGYWIGCPACVTLWTAVAVTTTVTVVTGLPRPVLAAAATAGGALLLDRVTS